MFNRTKTKTLFYFDGKEIQEISEKDSGVNHISKIEDGEVKVNYMNGTTTYIQSSYMKLVYVGAFDDEMFE